MGIPKPMVVALVILRPLQSGRKIRPVTVYDLEWIPGKLDVRVVGVYDERGFRWYPSIAEFLGAELNYRNSQRWYYAHAGGSADVQFIVERAMEIGMKFEAAFANSSAIIVRLERDRYKWTFADSYHLFNRPLAEIAKWIGLEKKAGDRAIEDMSEEEKLEFYRSAPLKQLVAYNRMDCEILWRAIHEYQLALLEMGGQLRLTQASCAMDLFRRKYLTREIEVSEHVNERARDAYFASRVEVFAPRCQGAKYYDINSSFPSAMRQPLPGSPVAMGRRPLTAMHLADVTIEIRDCYLPPTPARINDRLFFPTGRWRTWLSSVDLRLLEREGHRIMRIHEAIDFEPFTDLAAYATDLYERRKKETDPFQRATYKLLLNSLYGKFGEGSDKTRAIFDPPNPDELRRQGYEPLIPGLWLVHEHRRIAHAHVPIATWITAIARRALFEPMNRSDEVYYCDTDGFATNTEHPTSSELGGLKLEKKAVSARFLAPKLYRLEGEDEHGEPIEIYAGKGFSRLNRERFETLERGDAITIRRMSRLRGLWRSGETRPTEIEVSKRLRATVPKRCSDGNDNTRPWRVDELLKYS